MPAIKGDCGADMQSPAGGGTEIAMAARDCHSSDGTMAATAARKTALVTVCSGLDIDQAVLDLLPGDTRPYIEEGNS